MFHKRHFNFSGVVSTDSDPGQAPGLPLERSIEVRLGAARIPFHIVFADKKTNLAGLQLADLVARPVGLSYIRPGQSNQAFDVLKKKFFCDGGRAKVADGAWLGGRTWPGPVTTGRQDAR